MIFLFFHNADKLPIGSRLYAKVYYDEEGKKCYTRVYVPKFKRWDRWINHYQATYKALPDLLAIHKDDWDGETQYKGIPIKVLGFGLADEIIELIEQRKEAA